MNKAHLSLKPRKRMALRTYTGHHKSSYKRFWLVPAILTIAATAAAFVTPSKEVGAITAPPSSTHTGDNVPLQLPTQSGATAPASTLEGTSAPAMPEKVSYTLPADPVPSVSSPAPEMPDLKWASTEVKSGESLSVIFSRLGFTARELQNILDGDKDNHLLKHLYPGDQIRYQKDLDGNLQTLAYRYEEAHSLVIHRQDQGYESEVVEHPLEHRFHHTSGTIDDSLYLSAQNAGLSDRLTMELAGIFGWDVDFALDIRSGDRFTVIYDQVYQDGEFLRDGDIIAAEFVNQGQTYRAIRYTDEQGRTDYYTPEGKSLRKAFLRTPVAFTRISSRFTTGRWHPVLHHIRAHKGVDYAAPVGTPVKATSDGKISFLGRKGGYGRVVIIQHGQRYSTLYAHLSGYKHGLRSGAHVRQGQTVGYVGQSGLATGPHLHYEFRINGVHHNPLTVQLPDAAPLSSGQMAAFQDKTHSLVAQLDTLSRQATVIASR